MRKNQSVVSHFATNLEDVPWLLRDLSLRCFSQNKPVPNGAARVQDVNNDELACIAGRGELVLKHVAQCDPMTFFDPISSHGGICNSLVS